MLDASNQKRKLYAASVGLMCGIGFLGLAAVLFTIGHAGAAAAAFLAGGILLVGSSFYAARKIACPRCGLKWVQHALGHMPSDSWVRWLVTFERCPGCGASPHSAGVRRHKEAA